MLVKEIPKVSISSNTIILSERILEWDDCKKHIGYYYKDLDQVKRLLVKGFRVSTPYFDFEKVQPGLIFKY